MKLSTFITPSGAEHIGALMEDGTHLVDFTASSMDQAFVSMLALIDAGPSGLEHARSLLKAAKVVHALSAVQLRAPVPEPRQMRDFLSFEKHIRQARANRHLFGIQGYPTDPAKIEIANVWYEQPIYYKCNRFSVIGTGQDILWPRYSKMMDFELEFGIFLGKNGKNISREEANGYIFGYCIFNDMSARDAQMAEMLGQLGPAKGKDFDTGNILGPWLVTADEVPDPYALTMIARINGVECSRGFSGDMRFQFEDFIVHASMDEQLRAGEFMGSGTVGGGCGLEIGRFLEPGDVIELEVSGLGVMTNRLVKQTP
jgi:2-keto-4-pentenoate hydratase/2-oxohepta-3-ene-1,7-dioic acid hydratase in catechol pathway